MMAPAFETVSVIGLGYIGLPTAAMFASRKIEVVGVDLNHCRILICEPNNTALRPLFVTYKAIRLMGTG